MLMEANNIINLNINRCRNEIKSNFVKQIMEREKVKIGKARHRHTHTSWLCAQGFGSEDDVWLCS